MRLCCVTYQNWRYLAKKSHRGITFSRRLGLVVHFGAPALLGFEFLLFLELALSFFDAEAGVHF